MASCRWRLAQLIPRCAAPLAAYALFGRFLPRLEAAVETRRPPFLSPSERFEQGRSPAPGWEQCRRLDAGDNLSSAEQEYNPTPIINEVRTYVETWRILRNPDQWQVTPETARWLEHWRGH